MLGVLEEEREGLDYHIIYHHHHGASYRLRRGGNLISQKTTNSKVSKVAEADPQVRLLIFYLMLLFCVTLLVHDQARHSFTQKTQ